MNVRRAHIQTAIGKSTGEIGPPAIDPTLFGWIHEEPLRSLVPMLLPSNAALAPSYILKIFRCGCSSERPYFTTQCRCTEAKLPCIMFCTCQGDLACNRDANRTASCSLRLGPHLAVEKTEKQLRE